MFVYNFDMIILTGASASGKTVTALGLAQKYGVKKAITTSTREKRINEIDGVDYFFLSKEDFLNKAKQNLFVETTLYNGNYYGCGLDQVGDNKVIVLDLNGLHSFQQLNNKRVVSFFLSADEDTRKERMLSRGDKLEKISERLKNDKNYFSLKNIGHTDFVIDTTNKTIDEVIDLVYKLYVEKLKEN